jgi:uncharacterized protein YyaL (SSP411 family)
MRHPRTPRRLAGLATAVAAACLFTGAPVRAADKPEGGKPRPTNRLAHESSPYLLQHAHNPVDWYPWGPEAFARAKKEGKLVFLSIGYSSCHWCHVMERESFDNPEVAKILNQWFVCIKVDREERPDIDTVYMTALHVLGQRGGWPLSMWLTADGKPVMGGTYWPPEDREIDGKTARGFKSILTLMHDWQQKKVKDFPDINEQADNLAERTAHVLAGMLRGVALVDLDRKLVGEVVDALREEFDPEFGGFGSRKREFRGTKFPTPPYLVLLQHEAARTKSDELAGMVRKTLDRMAMGGIYDQVGGGFHRYSTERTWTVPHFEKMLYDNAQLVEIYAREYAATKNPLYRRVVQETLAFVGRELTSPEGAFYSALDADSDGEEGQFYVWTDAEINGALPDKADATLIRKIYCGDGKPNFEGKSHIFVLAKPLAEQARELRMTEAELEARLARLRQRLLVARCWRPRPFLDTKVLTGWNGQMIAGYAIAGQTLADPRYLEAAGRAADFVVKRLRTPEGRLLRTYGARPGQQGQARLNGYLDDYAYLAHGLLCLHDATNERRWLDEARSLTDTMVRLHGDPNGGGFFYTSNDHEKLFARTKDQYDGAQPSGNSMAASNLVRLWTKTGDDRYRALAEKTFKTFAGQLKANPTGLTFLADALAQFLGAQHGRAVVAANPREATASAQGAKKSDAMVKVEVKADKPDADGKQLVTLTLTVHEGWHIYANPPGLKDLEDVQTTVTITAKTKPEEVKVEYPEFKVIDDKVLGKYRVYEGKVTIKATVRRAKGDTSPLEVSVKLQACDDKQCLLPATIKRTVP